MAKASYAKISGPEGFLATLTPFEGNSLRGEERPTYINRGRYSGSEPLPDANRVIFVVYSYATPIGWVLIDGTVVTPDAKYSVTTSKGQSKVNAWLGAAIHGTTRFRESVDNGCRKESDRKGVLSAGGTIWRDL